MTGRREARGEAHARAALLGNPSNGYGSKAIGVIVPDFAAERCETVLLGRPR